MKKSYNHVWNETNMGNRINMFGVGGWMVHFLSCPAPLRSEHTPQIWFIRWRNLVALCSRAYLETYLYLSRISHIYIDICVHWQYHKILSPTQSHTYFGHYLSKDVPFFAYHLPLSVTRIRLHARRCVWAFRWKRNSTWKRAIKSILRK